MIADAAQAQQIVQRHGLVGLLRSCGGQVEAAEAFLKELGLTPQHELRLDLNTLTASVLSNSGHPDKEALTLARMPYQGMIIQSAVAGQVEALHEELQRLERLRGRLDDLLARVEGGTPWWTPADSGELVDRVRRGAGAAGVPLGPYLEYDVSPGGPKGGVTLRFRPVLLDGVGLLLQRNYLVLRDIHTALRDHVTFLTGILLEEAPTRTEAVCTVLPVPRPAAQ